MLRFACLVVCCGSLVVAAAHEGLTIERLIDIKHPSSPVWSPDGRHVAFVWERAGVQNLWFVDIGENAQPRALTTFTAGEVGGPFWSADGRAVYFAHAGDLWRAPIDETNAAAVWTTKAGESQIVPSPDRTRVAFVRDGDIWVRALADDAETRLTATPEIEGGPVWSPDGTRVAFTSAKVVRREYAPEYSGAKILYTVTERTPLDIQVASATGFTITTIAPNPAIERTPRWLDASHLIFERVSQDTKTREIVIADTATTDGRVLVSEQDEKWWSIPPAAQPGPQPSPDGRYVAFVSDRDGWDRVYVMPTAPRGATGGEPVAVSPAGREAWRPVWSPDGTRIIFDANSPEAPGTRQLYGVAMSAGRAGEPRSLTSGGGTNIAATWSPDSHSVVYQHTDAEHSADLFVLRHDERLPPQHLGDSMPADFNHAAFVKPQLVWIPPATARKFPRICSSRPISIARRSIRRSSGFTATASTRTTTAGTSSGITPSTTAFINTCCRRATS